MATAAPPRAPRGTSNIQAPPAIDTFQVIPIAKIAVSTNVRADVGDVDELAASISQVGILQPLRVRADGEGLFTLKIGHRRLAAAKLAGLVNVPAIVEEGHVDTEASRAIEQLVENIQRRDLNALEEAKALRGILDASKGMTQDQLAAKVGRSRPAVTNLLRILETDPMVQELVASGQLTAAHAKALAGLPPRKQVDWAQQTIDRRYSAHDVEQSIARDREWQQRQATEARETSRVRDDRVAKAIEKLPDKGAHIVVEKDYSNQGEPIVNRLKKAGYTNVSLGHVQSRSDTLGCDCGVTAIMVGYGGGISLKPGCVEQKHRDAKWKADNVESDRRRGREKRIQAGIAEHLRVALLTLEPKAARVVLWAVMDWSLNDWVKEHKGDRKKPDAWGELAELDGPELAAEIARFASKGFGDRYGVKLDWPAIAEAFGIPFEEPPAKPKGKKAAAS